MTGLPFQDPVFWSLAACGLIGIVLWLLGTRLAKNDPRVSGTLLEGLSASRDSILFALVAHLIAAMALWAKGLRGEGAWDWVFYVGSGALAQTVVAKMLGALLGRLNLTTGPDVAFKKDDPPPPPPKEGD